MLQAPIFVSPGAIPSVACLEWIVCKNQTVSREVRLSDSQEHGQGVFCRLGLELEAGSRGRTGQSGPSKGKHCSEPALASLFCS